MRNIKISFKNKVLIPILIIFVVAISVISINNYKLLEESVITRTNAKLEIFIAGIQVQIGHLENVLGLMKETLNRQHLIITRSVLRIIDREGAGISNEILRRLCADLGLVELNVVDSNGRIIHSNFDDYIGFEYSSTELTRPYMGLLDGSISEYSEIPRKDALSDSITHYSGISRGQGNGFIQTGFDANILGRIEESLNVRYSIEETRLGREGFGFVLLNGVVYAHRDAGMVGADVSGEGWFKSMHDGNGSAMLNIGGTAYYACYSNRGGYTVVGVIPEAEYNSEVNQAIFDAVVFTSIALAILIAAIYIVMHMLLRPIRKVTEGLGEIAKGNFEARVEGNYSDEFALIKNSVNDMVESITTYLNEKLDAERKAHEAEVQKLDLLLKVHFDSLTNVYNRRYLDETLNHLIRSLSRSGGKLSVLMADIDCFKQFNDRYGHVEGDVCLRIVAQAIEASITREDDFVARYGGEEFCVILPNTDESGARQVADRITANLKSSGIRNEGSSVSDHVTISIGITSGTVDHCQHAGDYIKRADEALYLSKRDGRDRHTFLPLT